MRKKLFHNQRRSNLLPRGDGHFQVCERVNENPYKLDFPGEYNVSATFNVSDLSLYDVGDGLRTNAFQEEGNDGDPSKSSKDEEEVQVPSAITRGRAKAFKGILITFVQDMLRNLKYIKEEEPRCIMSIQLLKDEEISSFGD